MSLGSVFLCALSKRPTALGNRVKDLSMSFVLFFFLRFFFRMGTWYDNDSVTYVHLFHGVRGEE